jgi:uncharacterized membrane protein
MHLDSLIPLFVAILSIGFLLGPIFGIIGLIRGRRHQEALTELKNRNRALEARLSTLESRWAELGPEPVLLEDVEAPPTVLKEEIPSPEPTPPSPTPDVSPTDLPTAEPPIPAEATRLHKPAALSDKQWWEDLEEKAGKRWMTWAGALALFLSASFFLKYAFDNEWLGPTGRVVLGIVAGIAILVVGDYCLRREMRALGQGLMGGALAILYVSLFAAFSLYELLPQTPAFLSMVLVTAAGVALAILHNAIPLAFIAVLGGLISPVLVATGHDPRDALFGYLTVLNLGVLAVAMLRRWRALDVLAFVGTWAFYWGWFHEFYEPAALIPALAWLAVFFLIFLLIPFVYQLRRGTSATLESFVMALANAAVSFYFAYKLLRIDYQVTLGFVALAMAASYVILAALARKRVPDDARTLFGLVGLSVIFLTLAVPLHLKLHGIMLAWALEGPVLLYLGYTYRYQPVRIAGLLVMALAAVRLFQVHWPLHHEHYVLFFNRHFASAMSVPLAAAAYAAIHAWRFDGVGENEDRTSMIASAIGGGFLATVIVQSEVSVWLQYYARDLGMNRYYLSSSVVPVVWAIGGAGFLIGGSVLRSRFSYYAGLVALGIALLQVPLSYQYGPNVDYRLFINIRFLCGALVTAVVFWFAFEVLRRKELFGIDHSKFVRVLFGTAGVALLFLLSIETYVYFRETIASLRKSRWIGQMSLSIVWGLYAIAALAIGFWKKQRALRVAALALLAITAVKLLLVDMSQVQQIYRIVSFVVLGIVMIGASFLYHRLEKLLGTSSGEEQ